MTHANLFSPSNRIHHSHYLHPEPTSQQSNSFRRSSGGAIRSLRKIPSTLFNKEKTPLKPRPSKDKFKVFVEPPVSQPMKKTDTSTRVPVQTNIEKVKTKSKPRKALADLLHWGNHSHIEPLTLTQQQNQPPKPSAPAVPPKTANMLKKFNRSPSTKSIQSQLSSLRPPDEPMASRPSMGDDPFVRKGEGAEVVDHVHKHDKPSPSVKSIFLDRRSSMSSGKALSARTMLNDRSKEIPERPKALSPDGSPISTTFASIDTLVNLPPRTVSLDKVPSTFQSSAPLPVVAEASTEVEETGKTLKRDKTKSRIWGLLGKARVKKNKDQPEGMSDTWAKPVIHVPADLSLSAHIDEKYAATTVNSGITAMRPGSSRPRPPMLHISAPSLDDYPMAAQSTSSINSLSHIANKLALDGNSDTRQPDTLSRYPISSGEGGVWESVVGTIADRPSESGARHALEELMGPSRLPKRKSLTGLFGVAIRKSMEKIKSSSPPRAIVSRYNVSPPRLMAEPALKSLAGGVEEKSEAPRAVISSGGFESRFASSLAQSLQAEIIRGDGLNHVAAATHKLLHLVSDLDLSPASSNSPTVQITKSTNSLRQVFNSSPTPIRRIRSAMLTSKASSSSLKPSSANVSPLELALHRSQVPSGLQKTAQQSTSPPRQSMVRKGMRNIFAPPSPAAPKSSNATDLSKLEGHTVNPELDHLTHPTQDRMPSETNLREIRKSDVPADLKAIIVNSDTEALVTSPSKRTSLGLPEPPPQDRISPRRPAPAPPALSLPPEPDLPSKQSIEAVPLAVGQLDVGDSVNGTDCRNSFDFTNEYASLDQGSQRASFVDALKRVGSLNLFTDNELSPVPTVPQVPTTPDQEAVPTFHISKPSDSDTRNGDNSEEHEDDDDDDDDDNFEDAVEIQRVVGFARSSPVRKEPFRGQLSFQQHMTMAQPSHASFGAPEPALAEEAPAVHAHRRGHRRGESGFSIATMSSIGDVIGAGSEREYTNYFDVNFGSHLDHVHQSSITETAENIEQGQSPDPERYLDTRSRLCFDAKNNARSVTRRGHHRRNSSVQSLDSVDSNGDSIVSGPPISMHNRRRSSYISKHRRNSSSDSTFGRPNWAAHRRNSSSASTATNTSVSQIVRPGLGERMFVRDGGVQLTSITGSPPDDGELQDRQEHHRIVSWDSMFDCTRSRENDSLFDSAPDSIFDSSAHVSRSSMDNDSIFGPEQQTVGQGFLLRGLRPVSTISTATTSTDPDDTFANVSRWSLEAQPISKTEERTELCWEAVGENMSSMTPIGSDKPTPGRQALGMSFSRPPRPGQRRPPHLMFADTSLDTPGLTSPSASEASSRTSLDTNAASITLGNRTRPRGSGHYRQKSSAGVKIDATIHEMPSIATVRANKSSASPGGRVISMKNSHSTIRDHEVSIIGPEDFDEDDDLDRMRSIRRWLDFEREAEYEFKKTRRCWMDSEASKLALSEWKMPKTTGEIAAFLAQSTQTYKPLEKLPTGGHIANRRKSSLSDCRMVSSPYGLPLPKPPGPNNKPKMSLTTKYEKKNSTSSSTSASSTLAFTFPFPDDVPEPPSAPPFSAVFAPFARETPISPPPKPAPFQPALPFQHSTHDAFGLRKQLKKNKGQGDGENGQRPRVTSNARREALGWGRRRMSDGPEKTVGLGVDNARAVHLGFKSHLKAPGASIAGGKENATVGIDSGHSSVPRKEENAYDKTRSTRLRGPTPARKRGPRQVASQPLGLRL
ncbi:hypothetical protein IAR55_003373 [Kwoniella newhampshirensis]|uniref:Uncharacterized protein n=1 Tax=Kwoniella newhampshirensis TaxID=1651941 RepID=A0AAW0YRJ6_9TREE